MKTTKITPPIDERFDAYVISNELANRVIGRALPGEVTFADSEQGDARRRLLHVEKLAVRQKLSNAKAHAAKVESVSCEVHHRIIKVLTPQFEDGTFVAKSILGLSVAIPNLLDLLSTRACSVSRLEPIMEELPWLQEALIRAMNSSEHRRYDSKGKPLNIESVRTAIAAMGIENLRTVFPYFIFRHATPQITDPYPQIKNKIAEFQLGVANGAMRLARLHGLPTMDAYTLGMFSGLGTCAAIRQYFREFDKVLNDYAKDAMDERDAPTHRALQFVQPSPYRICELRQTFAHDLTTRALEFMVFKRLRILPAWQDNTHPLNGIIHTATEYAKLKQLLALRLVDKDEAKQHLQSLKIDRDTLAELNKPGLFKLVVDHS